MISVLIKGMKMPTCCEKCAFVRTVGLDRWKCELSGCNFNSWDVGWGDEEENKYIRHSSCPLVGLPPHGRLVDVDDVFHVLTAYYHHSTDFQHEALKESLARVSTIIPAEDGE